MSEQTTAVIEAVTSKEGATNGKPWRKYTVKTEDGTFYSTFSKEVAEQAHNLVGQRADIMWKASGDQGQFRDVIAARMVNGSAAVTNGHGAPADAIPTARTESGGADWDVIGLRKTRCLLWAEFLGSPLAAQHYAQNLNADLLYKFGTIVIELAERDIYWREPATEDVDVPFG